MAWLESFWYNDSFFFFWQHHAACGILILQLKIKYGSLAMKAQSPNHWNARDSPVIHSGMQSSGTMFLSISFIILVWCLCFTWVAFFSCLMLFGCSLFKTNMLIRLIRLWSALQGWAMACGLTGVYVGVGPGGNYLVGNTHKDSMLKSFSLVNFPVTCLAAELLCLECRSGQGWIGGGRIRRMFWPFGKQISN